MIKVNSAGYRHEIAVYSIVGPHGEICQWTAKQVREFGPKVGLYDF